MAFLFLALLFSCNSPLPQTGISKDINTGLQATYKNLHPENVLLVMNGEELNGADIPLGESFILVNDKTTGFVAKNGKISVGCSLQIKDENGNTLMNEPDLFRDNDILEANPTTVLRCTVNTGKPMQVGEKYKVSATFWDKYGDGSIVNNITVRMTGAN